GARLVRGGKLEATAAEREVLRLGDALEAVLEELRATLEDRGELLELALDAVFFGALTSALRLELLEGGAGGLPDLPIELSRALAAGVRHGAPPGGPGARRSVTFPARSNQRARRGRAARASPGKNTSWLGSSWSRARSTRATAFARASRSPSELSATTRSSST